MGRPVLNRRAAARRALVLFGAGMLACPAVLQANTTYTWNGGNAGTGYWDVGANWGGTAPPTSGPSDLVFGSVNLHSPNQPYIEFNYNISSITFNSSALAYAMGTSNNNTIAVGSGGITDAASSAESFSMGLILSTSQTWNVGNSLGVLTLNGSLTNSSSSTLTKTGAGTLNLALPGTTSSIGGLSLQGGLTQLTSGTLSALTSGLGVSSGTQLNVSGGAILNAGSAAIDVVFAGGSVINVTGAGSQLNASLSGSQINVGDTNNGAFLNITSGGSVSGTLFLFDMNGGITINSGGTMSVPVTVLGNSTGLTGTATISGSGSALNASSFVALGGDGAAAGTGKLLITNSGAVNTPLFQFESSTSSVNVSGGTLNAGALTSLNNGFGAITVTDPSGGYSLNINGTSGTNTYSGSISGTGTLNKSGGSTQILSGTLACGGVLVNSGVLQLSLATSSSNAIDHLSVTGGTALMNSGSLSATSNQSSGLYVNNGTFNLSGGAKFTSTSNGPVNAIIDANGSVIVSGVGSLLSFPNAGGLGEFDVGEYTGHGTLSVTNSGNVSSGFFVLVGGFQSGASGTLSISSSGTVTAPYPAFGYVAGTTGTGTVTGAGSILNATSNLELGGDSTFASYGGTGILTIASGGSVNAAATTFYSNTSSINISGGTLITGGLSSANTGYGSISLTDPSGGYALNINGSSGTNAYSGSITGTGTLNKSGGSTQTLSGTLNCGTIVVTAGTLNLALAGNNNAANYLNPQGGLTQVTSGTLALSGVGAQTGIYVQNQAVLNISGGAIVNASGPSHNLDIAVDGGTINVTGNGSQLNGQLNQISVGYFAPGILNVSNGATVSSPTFLVIAGGSSGSNGSSMSILSGGKAVAPVTGVGLISGAIGTLTVNGTGSTLNATSFVALGGDGSVGGTGLLNIANAGVVNAASTAFYSQPSSINISGGTLNTGSVSSFNNGFGAITVTDPTSGYALNINGSSGTNTYSGKISGTGTLLKTGASTQILANGNSSIGALLLQGGALNVSGGSLALTTTAMNSFSVTGGLLTISNGAKVTATGAGNIDGPAGTGITVNGANSMLSLPGYFPIGDSAQGTLTISQGGSVSTQTLFADCPGAVAISSGGTLTTTFPGIAAGGASDVATVTIDGLGSAWNTINLSVGGYGGPGGTATVTLTNQAALTATGTTFLDSNSATINVSGGTMTTGALSSFNTGNGAIILTDPAGGTALTINDPTATDTNTYSGTFAGTGTLLKTGGSTQVLSGGGTLGAISLQGGTTLITAGTLSLNSTTDNPDFYVSNASTLNISGGATVNVLFTAPGGLNVQVDGNSSATVTGTGSLLSAGFQIDVGYASPGTLNVSNGGSVSSGTFLVVGGPAFGSSAGTGTLTISSGGVVTAPVTVLGYLVGSTGTATVTGAGSTLNAASFVALGGDGSAGGTGTLVITNSGAVNTPLVDFESSTSSVNVSGGTLNTGGLVSVNPGNGSIILTDPSGGTALTINGSSGTSTYSGTFAGTGTLLKTGGSTQTLSGGGTLGAISLRGGTTLINAGSLSITSTTDNPGFYVTNSSTLNISGGATVNVPATGVINVLVDGNSSASVSGAGSLLSAGVQLDIGYFTPGTLTVSNGGSVSSGIFLEVGGPVGGSSGGTGTLTISSGGTVTAPETFVGRTTGATGTITVTGAGSTLSDTSYLALGGNGSVAEGTGILAVISGGAVDTALTDFDSATSSANVSGGTLNTGGLSSLNTGFGAITLTDPSSGYALNINGATGTSTYSGTISGTGSLNKSGGSTQILAGADSFTGQTIVSGGELILSGTNRLGSMNISSGIVQVTGPENVLSLLGLTIGGTGTLDLTTDSADISGGSLSAITALAKLGYANGAWNGSGGISSSAATADSRHLTAIGVIQNNQSGAALYTAAHQLEGITPGAGDILAKYTYYGDTDLDGKVDATDYSRIDNGYLNHLTSWFNGDLNYDGVINGSDYTLIDNAFNTQGAQIDSQIAASAEQIAGSAAVPEPSGVIAFLAGVLLSRRQRKGFDAADRHREAAHA